RKLKIHLLRIWPIEEPASLGRARDQHIDRPAVVKALEVSDGGLVRPLRFADKGPVGDRSAQDRGLAAACDVFGQGGEPARADFTRSLQLVEHRALFPA